MKTENHTMLLRIPEIEPSDIVLEEALGKEVFAVYQELTGIITNEFGLEYEWRYYKDGKSWLFKATYKKKTIFWLSLWDQFIKTSFYFTEKSRSGIFDLPVSGKIKDDFDTIEPIGKLIPLILDIDCKEQLIDFRELVRYKKSLK